MTLASCKPSRLAEMPVISYHTHWTMLSGTGHVDSINATHDSGRQLANLQSSGISNQSLVERNNSGTFHSWRIVSAEAWCVSLTKTLGKVNKTRYASDSLAGNKWVTLNHYQLNNSRVSCRVKCRQSNGGSPHKSLQQWSQIARMVTLCLNLLSNLFKALQITMSAEERFWQSEINKLRDI